MTDRDVYTDGLARRAHPPDTYQGALERLGSRGVVVVARMPTRYEIEAQRAATGRRVAIWAMVDLALMFALGFVVGYIAFR
jgi:hypothetical protein